MSVAKNVHPFSIFPVPKIGPDHDALVGFIAFQLAIVGNLTDPDHSIASREVLNMVDLSVNGLQSGEELFPGFADLVATLKKVRPARRMKKTSGLLVNNPITLSVSSSLWPSRSWWSSSRFAATTSLGKAFVVCATATIAANTTAKDE